MVPRTAHAASVQSATGSRGSGSSGFSVPGTSVRHTYCAGWVSAHASRGPRPMSAIDSVWRALASSRARGAATTPKGTMARISAGQGRAIAPGIAGVRTTSASGSSGVVTRASWEAANRPTLDQRARSAPVRAHATQQSSEPRSGAAERRYGNALAHATGSTLSGCRANTAAAPMRRPPARGIPVAAIEKRGNQPTEQRRIQHVQRQRRSCARARPTAACPSPRRRPATRGADSAPCAAWSRPTAGAALRVAAATRCRSGDRDRPSSGTRGFGPART